MCFTATQKQNIVSSWGFGQIPLRARAILSIVASSAQSDRAPSICSVGLRHRLWSHLS